MITREKMITFLKISLRSKFLQHQEMKTENAGSWRLLQLENHPRYGAMKLS